MIGLLLRLHRFGQPFLGDEISTLYLVKGESLGGVVSSIASDKEISPPLYFMLAWAASKLGSSPELIRLPSLIAGLLSIPLIYLVGLRTVGRLAGVLAAAVMTLTPFMLFYSGDGRTYGVAIALLLGSTLAMLAGARDGRTRWWVLYAVLTALAMYTHYTAGFVLAAQLLWLLWAYPQARKPAILANVGAVVLFAPWIPSMLADFDSPTVKILSALQGDGFLVKRIAVESWAFGYPYVLPQDVPGHPALFGIVAALALAVVAVVVQLLRGHRAEIERRVAPKGAVLVVMMALATPVAEALILWLTGNDLFGARNLIMSSAGLALAIGALLAAAGVVWGGVSIVVVMLGLSVAAARSLKPENGPVRFDEAARFIDANAEPGDVVVDAVSASVSPVPLTPLDIYRENGETDHNLFFPTGEPPFLPYKSTPLPGNEVLRQALEEAEGHRLFLVAPDLEVTEAKPGQKPRITDLGKRLQVKFTDLPSLDVHLRLPHGGSVLERERWDSLAPLNVYVIDPGPGEGSQDG